MSNDEKITLWQAVYHISFFISVNHVLIYRFPNTTSKTYSMFVLKECSLIPSVCNIPYFFIQLKVCNFINITTFFDWPFSLEVSLFILTLLKSVNTNKFTGSAVSLTCYSVCLRFKFQQIAGNLQISHAP